MLRFALAVAAFFATAEDALLALRQLSGTLETCSARRSHYPFPPLTALTPRRRHCSAHAEKCPVAAAPTEQVRAPFALAGHDFSLCAQAP